MQLEPHSGCRRSKKVWARAAAREAWEQCAHWTHRPPALLCLSFNAAFWQFTLHSPWLHLWVAAGHMQLLKQAAPGVQLGCREEVGVQSALCLAVMCMLRSAHPLHNQATFYRQAVLLSRAAPHFHAASSLPCMCRCHRWACCPGKRSSCCRLRPLGTVSAGAEKQHQALQAAAMHTEQLACTLDQQP